jgi:hypothetical protein
VSSPDADNSAAGAYARVLLVWVAVLVALYALQEYYR